MNKIGLTYVEPASYITEEMKEILFEEDYKRIREFVTKYPWTFAKTYAEFAPHEYYVKDELDEHGQAEFVWFVEYIRDNGFDCKFAGKEYTYFQLDGHYYWTMGEPIEETIILNRCDKDKYVIQGESMVFNKS